jgi:tRNA-uridine 2-sulfurtransferase
VFAYFLAEYQAGRTPNPDVLCNAEIKFKAFLDHAMSLGADHHRHRPLRPPGWRVRRTSPPAQGGRCQQGPELFSASTEPAPDRPALFPLGELTKPEVRELARRAGFPVAEKKDSTGICFIGERPFREFLQRYMPIQPATW